SKLCKGKYYPADATAAQRFYEYFALDNDQLRGLAFPGRHEPLFDEDFSDYPHEVGPREIYADAVEVAIALWNDMERSKRELLLDNELLRARLSPSRSDHNKAKEHLLNALKMRPRSVSGHLEMARICTFLADIAGASISLNK